MPRLNPDFRAVMNHFVYSMVNGLLGYPLLDSVDYRPALMEEGSAAEQAAAIFCNVLELDEDGKPVNANEAESRAAQYLRAYCDRTYEVEPPFEDWELDRPPRKGKKLGPMPLPRRSSPRAQLGRSRTQPVLACGSETPRAVHRPACGPLALGVLGQLVPGKSAHRRGCEVGDRGGKILLEPDNSQPRLVKHRVKARIDRT